MMDLRRTIVPKSDQLNADDLIGGPRTITITKIAIAESSEQPVSINFEGDGGKPYKPCKSMRRVLVQAWGADGGAYIGRGLTLFRDDKATFGGMEVGGIRISHMSHIKEPITMVLTVSKAKRAPFVVKPLAVAKAQAPTARPAAPADDGADAAARNGTPAYQAFVKAMPSDRQRAYVATAGHAARKVVAAEADLRAKDEPSDTTQAPPPQTPPADATEEPPSPPADATAPASDDKAYF